MVQGIVVLCKSWLELTCGALNTMGALRRLGKDVLCICSACRPETRADLEAIGVRVEEIHPEDPLPRDTLGKIRHYARFRKRAWHILNQENREALRWVIRIDTAMALGRRLLERPYILTLQELHDRFFLFQRAIRLYASHASTVVVPEYCRANILRCWCNLDRTPFVLPNRPTLESRERDLPVSDSNAARILSSIPKERRILLYQGGLDADRDLVPIAKAAAELREDYCLVLMGEDRSEALSRLRPLCPDLIHIPWVRPPAHLQITSHAHIGIAFYKFDALNSIFCAPNKIWEYSAYGIPMICQDIPGLRYSVGVAQAGVCVNSENVGDIVDGVRRIEHDYSHYSQKAREFYESVDTNTIVSRIVNSACSNS